jgi:hypothetical protein
MSPSTAGEPEAERGPIRDARAAWSASGRPYPWMDRTSSRPDCPVPSAERRVATSLPAASRYMSEISQPSPLRRIMQSPARAGFDDLAAHDDPGRGGHRQLLSSIAVLSRIFGARRFADLQRRTRPAITPPSTSWNAPVVQLALSDRRNTMWLARSSGRPTRPIGWNALNLRSGSARPCPDR